MARQRVQVRDLEAPERIQPAPVQSDTYARPAQPPIDHSLEALQKGLAMFGSSALALGEKQKREDEKRLKQEHLAAYEVWKSSKSSTEQLDAVRSGQLPFWHDPILAEVTRKDYARNEAISLAGEIDKDRTAENSPFGRAGFDADAYVREKAKPFVERVARDPRAMIYFGDELDRLRGVTTKAHQEALGKVQTQHIESVGRRAIGEVIVAGVRNGNSPDQINDTLRKLYKEIGPRVGKGSLDLNYGRLDDLLVENLEEMAKSPETAEMAAKLTGTVRKTVDGTAPIGSLGDVAHRRDKVMAIRKAAQNTLAVVAEDDIKTKLRVANLRALEAGGTFSTIVDFKSSNPVDPAKEVKVSRDQQRDQAVRDWLDGYRQRNGTDNPQAEIDYLMDRGVKHPEYAATFNEAYNGFLSTNLSTPGGAERQQELAKLGLEYTRIAERNVAYAKSLVSSDAQDFYETFRILHQYAGRTPEGAARETIAAFSTASGAKDPQIIQGNLRKIEDTVATLDLKPWWPGGTVVNTIQVKQHLIPIARALARAEGVDINTILERATGHIQKQSALVNGRVVISPNLKAGDENYVQPLLDRIFEKHKGALDAQGITKSNQLSLYPDGPQSFLVVKWDGGEVHTPASYDKDGKPQGLQFYRIAASDIVDLRMAGRREDEAKGLSQWWELTKPLAPVEKPAPGTPRKSPTEIQKEAIRRGMGVRIQDPNQ